MLDLGTCRLEEYLLGLDGIFKLFGYHNLYIVTNRSRANHFIPFSIVPATNFENFLTQYIACLHPPQFLLK